MKKIISTLILLALVFSLASCQSNPIYSSLTTLANKPCAMVKLSITASIDGEKLYSSYKITETLISYNIDVFNSLSLGEDNEFIITKSGEAFIENGEITSFNGDAVEIPEYETLVGKFTFRENNFKNAEITESTFSADVIDLGALFGTESSAKAGKIYLEFTLKKITKITLSYTESGAFVSAVYEFI